MKKDFFASIVVFLVALPLCMGIAIASNVPVVYGLLSGIIGGLIVGPITGSPLQVSGPAAGLVVIVFGLVQKYGIAGLGMATFLAGVIQIISARFKAGPYFRAISPSVIRGMLSGIGVIILFSQFHVMLDISPKASPLENLAMVPSSLAKIFDRSLGVAHSEAAFLGCIAILIILLWNSYKEKYNLIVPGALVGIAAVTSASFLLDLPVKKVNLEGSFLNVFSDNLIFSNISLFSWEILFAAIPLALVATAETLLCTNAIEKLRPSVQVDYNKELMAQGWGNLVCGIFGALPITGVIVRSAANAEAGALTKKSTIMHGAWLFLFCALLGSILIHIPTSALASILVVTGLKLINLKELRKSYQTDKQEFAIWFITIVSIVSIDLLVGIGIGFALSLLKLLFSIHNLEIKNSDQDEHSTEVHLSGKASFLTLPSIAKIVEGHALNKNNITLNTEKLLFKDLAVDEYLENIQKTYGHRGINIKIASQEISNQKGITK